MMIGPHHQKNWISWMKDKTIIMNLIEGLKMKIDTLEKLSHEPQNYKKKCDEMEKRLVKLENIITEMSNENTKSTNS